MPFWSAPAGQMHKVQSIQSDQQQHSMHTVCMFNMYLYAVLQDKIFTTAVHAIGGSIHASATHTDKLPTPNNCPGQISNTHHTPENFQLPQPTRHLNWTASAPKPTVQPEPCRAYQKNHQTSGGASVRLCVRLMCCSCVCLIAAAMQQIQPRSALCTTCFLHRSCCRGSPHKLSTALQQKTQEQVCVRHSCNSPCAPHLDVVEDPRTHSSSLNKPEQPTSRVTPSLSNCPLLAREHAFRTDSALHCSSNTQLAALISRLSTWYFSSDIWHPAT